MSAKSSPLSSSLVVRKGQAAPTAPARAPLAPPPPTPAPVATAPAKEVLTALTLKLDDRRYQRLKELGMRRPRRTSQDILVAALDAYLIDAGV